MADGFRTLPEITATFGFFRLMGRAFRCTLQDSRVNQFEHVWRFKGDIDL